jgi:hypothetical protein
MEEGHPQRGKSSPHLFQMWTERTIQRRPHLHPILKFHDGLNQSSLSRVCKRFHGLINYSVLNCSIHWWGRSLHAWRHQQSKHQLLLSHSARIQRCCRLKCPIWYDCAEFLAAEHREVPLFARPKPRIPKARTRTFNHFMGFFMDNYAQKSVIGHIQTESYCRKNNTNFSLKPPTQSLTSIFNSDLAWNKSWERSAYLFQSQVQNILSSSMSTSSTLTSLFSWD